MEDFSKEQILYYVGKAYKELLESKKDFDLSEEKYLGLVSQLRDMPEHILKSNMEQNGLTGYDSIKEWIKNNSKTIGRTHENISVKLNDYVYIIMSQTGISLHFLEDKVSVTEFMSQYRGVDFYKYLDDALQKISFILSDNKSIKEVNAVSWMIRKNNVDLFKDKFDVAYCKTIEEARNDPFLGPCCDNFVEKYHARMLGGARSDRNKFLEKWKIENATEEQKNWYESYKGLNEIVSHASELFPTIPPEVIKQAKDKIIKNYLNDPRSFEDKKQEIFSFAKKVIEAEKIVNRDIDQEVLDKSVLLIGPMGTGKSTIAKNIEEKTGMPRVSLDDRKALHNLYEHRKDFRDFKEFEFFLTAQTLTSLEEPAVIDFGAGHSVYENPIMFYEMKKLTDKFQNVVLLMPSEDKKESLQIVNDRVKKRNVPNAERVMKDNEHFVMSPYNYDIAKQTVYTKGKNAEEVTQEVGSLVKGKDNKTLTLNNQNATPSAPSNGFGYTAMLVAIVSFAIGVISTITYLIVSSIFK